MEKGLEIEMEPSRDERKRFVFQVEGKKGPQKWLPCDIPQEGQVTLGCKSLNWI